MSPLYEEIASLRKELESYKRGNAALQIRRAIEKLVHEIPDIGRYHPAPGNKWKIFWKEICDDVEKNRNDTNPFYKTSNEANGLEVKDIKRGEAYLYSEMSAEIHGYGKKEMEAFDYENFDGATRKITRVLRPRLDEITRQENWKKEIKQYSFIQEPTKIA